MLPPLNGFVSEWLTFQALLQNLPVARPALNLVFALALAGLALTAGLAAACFVKAFGHQLPGPAAQRGGGPGPRGAGGHARGHGRPRGGLRRARAWAPPLVVPVLAAVAESFARRAACPRRLGTTVRVSGDFARVSTLAVAIALALAAAGARWSPSGSPAPRPGRRLARRGAAAACSRPRAWSTRRPPSRTLQASVRLLLPAAQAARHRRPSRVALLRAAHRLREFRRAPSSTTGCTPRDRRPCRAVSAVGAASSRGAPTSTSPTSSPPSSLLLVLRVIARRSRALAPAPRRGGRGAARSGRRSCARCKARLVGRRGPRARGSPTAISRSSSARRPWSRRRPRGSSASTPYLLAATMLVAAAGRCRS